VAKTLSEKVLAWVESQQGRHACACGCGGAIPVTWRHHYRGIPEYLWGHNGLGPAEERFWSRVIKRGSCWEYTSPRDARGYGKIGLGGRNGKDMLAHRFSWELHNGPVPEGLCVCHRCDNPPCVNPVHLFLGTTGDNTADAARKGRLARGERVKGAKLTAEAVREIRREAAAGTPQRALAGRFGVGEGAISMIVNRRLWRHV
jgi:hypothetical protein